MSSARAEMNDKIAKESSAEPKIKEMVEMAGIVMARNLLFFPRPIMILKNLFYFHCDVFPLCLLPCPNYNHPISHLHPISLLLGNPTTSCPSNVSSFTSGWAHFLKIKVTNKNIMHDHTSTMTLSGCGNIAAIKPNN